MLATTGNNSAFTVAGKLANYFWYKFPTQTAEKSTVQEYFRPWKMFTFLCGLGLLIFGAYYYDAPDWDVPISFIMAILTYLTAPWSLRVILERRWKLLPGALIATWFTVDGSYWLYWHYKNPAALEMMREANFFASLALYGICGVVWLYRGSLREMSVDAYGAIKNLLTRT